MSANPFWVNELFWGIIGLIGIGIAILVEMRKNRGLFDDILSLLKVSATTTADEKIAVIFAMANEVSLWRNINQNTDLTLSRLRSDLNTLGRIRNKMTWEQWVELHRALSLLIQQLQNNNYQLEANEIEIFRESLR
jgi:hypothetical protein